jgi:hypothetical protein
MVLRVRKLIRTTNLITFSITEKRLLYLWILLIIKVFRTKICTYVSINYHLFIYHLSVYPSSLSLS